MKIKRNTRLGRLLDILSAHIETAYAIHMLYPEQTTVQWDAPYTLRWRVKARILRTMVKVGRSIL